MTDRDIVKVRLSGTGISRIADYIEQMDGWTVLERSAPRRNKRDPGERIYLAVRYGYPPVSDITAWLAANGWESPGGSAWYKGGWRGAHVSVPADGTIAVIRFALTLIAAAEGRPLHEFITAIETGKDTADGHEH